MEARESSMTTSGDAESGTYVLRDLISDIPLQGEHEEQVYITCVDAWNGNVYIGTSAGEVLHYVSIPPDPADQSGQPTYIFATRLEPQYSTVQQGADRGVKQILILPEAGKACILCNATLTFYSLPELSPAYGDRIRQGGCLWVGGLDVNENGPDRDGEAEPVIVICLRAQLRVVRLGRQARNIREIKLPGVCAMQRRGDLACVADGSAYSLLDMLNQRANKLFPIFSNLDTEAERPLPELPTPESREHPRNLSATSPSPTRRTRGHERYVSLGVPSQAEAQARMDSPSRWPARNSSISIAPEATSSSRGASPVPSRDPTPRASLDVPSKVAEPTGTITATILPPNIVSPSATEFLLVTGTHMAEVGIGMFVNMEGDPSRAPIEFSSYPKSLVLDGPGEDSQSNIASPADSEGYALALVQRIVDGNAKDYIEVQRWDVEAGDPSPPKEWIELSSTTVDDGNTRSTGLRLAISSAELMVPEVALALRSRRLALKENTDQEYSKRNAEEDEIANQFARIRANVLLYTRDTVKWVTKNPLLVRLDRRLQSAIKQADGRVESVDALAVQYVINDIRGQDARDVLEFQTLTYIRRKASILLFGNLVLKAANNVGLDSREIKLAEEALIAGEIDPRVILIFVAPLDEEVCEGEHGIWVEQGLKDATILFKSSVISESTPQEPMQRYGKNLLTMLKRFLLTWRTKKGFGSVADEALVSKSVDAALLHVLLLLDQSSPRGTAVHGSVRAELNKVVDGGVDCFDRAVELFEQFHRLYMLSRLYQSRKSPAQVLATWKRIMDGEEDAGGELVLGEQEVRKYLTMIRDRSLVLEYGAWLADRNPKLGVQVFADDSSRVKFEPSEAVAILKEKAPGAVKDYLEHLVFGKNHVQYVNDLIAFYLDTVLTQFESSDVAKNILLQSYETYRALHPPKPTYRQFIEDNAVDAEWWRNRLRLLQLIGGSHGAASKYDVHALRERLAPYCNELVPEMIILNGREGKHEEALRLLTHGLGDYDTAIRYCLLGGSNIFHAGSGIMPSQPLPSKDEQAVLFEYLLNEFSRIEDLSERLERTSELLERFGGWFEIGKVLDMIPDGWSVEIVSGFLIHAFRRLVRDRNETVVAKALASAQNLKRNVDLIEKVESFGPTVITKQIEAG